METARTIAVCHLVQDFSILCDCYFIAHLCLKLTLLKMVREDALTFPSCPCFPTWLIYSSKNMCQVPLLDLPV